MIETIMKERLERIFDIDKVTFDKPGESKEQKAVFVDVSKESVRVIDAREIAKVEGVIHVFAPSNELPFGFFAKKLAKAKLEDVKGFFFGPEENVGVYRNVAERKFDFTFLFDSQYDPAIGTITSLTTTYAES